MKSYLCLILPVMTTVLTIILPVTAVTVLISMNMDFRVKQIYLFYSDTMNSKLLTKLTKLLEA